MERLKNVCVTGGAGFIGSHLCIELLARGYNVTCIDNLRTGKLSNIALCIDNSRFKFVEASVTDYPMLLNKFSHIDTIYHQAGLDFTTCESAPDYALEQITDAMVKVTQAAMKNSVRKIVFASTGSVLNGNPVSCYGVAKYAAEGMLRIISKYTDGMTTMHHPWVEYTILRYYNVYGTRQNDNPEHGGVIPIFINNALQNKTTIIHGDGSQTRQFTSVGDIVKANIYSSEYNCTNGRTYDVCSDRVVSIEELANLTVKNSPRKYVPMRNGDVMEFGGDNTELKSLGFEFDNNFEDNIARLINYRKIEMETGNES